MISNYPTVFAIGHRAIENLFDGPVLVEEKIDGSQFSFMLEDGVKYAKAKKAILYPLEPESGGMFNAALRTVNELDLHEGWIYRGEYLSKPKHNVLNYDRVPPGWIILYDIEVGQQAFLSHDSKTAEARRLGLMCVPMLNSGVINSIEQFQALLDLDSCLGGCKVEGVVVKNYNIWTTEKKIAIGKYVSEAFKESHDKSWKAAKEPIDALIGAQLRTEARWEKTVQHLRDEERLLNAPQDIGPLLKELASDTLVEEGARVQERLFKHFWPHIVRHVAAGFPEWYKERLLKSAFEVSDDC